MTNSPLNYRCSSFNSDILESSDKISDKKLRTHSFRFAKSLTPLLSTDVSKDSTESEIIPTEDYGNTKNLVQDKIDADDKNKHKKILIETQINYKNKYDLATISNEEAKSSKIDSTDNQIDLDKINKNDNFSQKLFQSSRNDQTPLLSNNSLQVVAPVSNFLLESRLNRHTSLILPNRRRCNRRSYNDNYNFKLNNRNTVSGIDSQQNRTYYYDRNPYDWTSVELMGNEKSKRINSCSGLHTLFNPLCPIHGHRALIETYTRDKFIKVILLYFFNKKIRHLGITRTSSCYCRRRTSC